MLAPVSVNQILTITEGMHPTAVEQKGAALPSEYRLQQNYPNPFQSAATSSALSGGISSTRIEYVLPRASFVRLAIYNAAGQEVRLLFNQMQSAGTYMREWAKILHHKEHKVHKEKIFVFFVPFVVQFWLRPMPR